MKIAFIHNEKKLQTGAHNINDLISRKLKERGIILKHFYPSQEFLEKNVKLRGIENILFYHGLLEQQKEILECDLIQGTTYTPLAFLPLPIPTICHFGSTTNGFIKNTPLFNNLDKKYHSIWKELLRRNVIKELNLKTRRPLQEIRDIEFYAGRHANATIATSKIVADDLASHGIPRSHIHLVHNAIPDFWFKPTKFRKLEQPNLVYIGRLGGDVFTLQLKGFDRLIHIYRAFPKTWKTTVAMTPNSEVGHWTKRSFERQIPLFNLSGEEIKDELANLRGSIFLGVSRYEGFCLSLIEGMSQGLIPVTFPTGIAPEIIEDGKNGFLVKNIEEMKSRIKKILTDENLREHLASGAEETAKKFEADIMADRLLGIYKKVLKTN